MTDACPLCGCGALMATKRVATAPLKSYWAAAGHDVDAHYDAFPDSFTVKTCARCGLGTYDPPVIGGPELYAAIGGQEFYYSTARWDHQAAARFLAQNEVPSLLEFGCGAGAFLDYARHLVTRVAGLDVNPDAVAKARERGLDVQAEWDALGEGRYTAVVALQTLEHVADPGRLVARLLDRLEPGGYFIVSVPNEDGPLGELVFNPLNAPPHHATLWPRSALEHIAEAHGLSIEIYATEPINRLLYDTYVGESVQAAWPGKSFAARIVRKVMGLKVRADAAWSYAAARDALPDGHNHLAVFRKPGGNVTGR